MENPQFHLEGVVKEHDELRDFEGPLSLILLLLKKNKIEIRDIKISEILEQYLEYLDALQQMDLEIASEFVEMASYLLYIKTKTLIASDDEEVSELEALIESLEQLKAKDAYVAVKEVAPMLLEAYQKGALFCSKGPEPLPASASEYPYHHSPQDLLSAMLHVFSATGEKPMDVEAIRSAMPARIVYSVRNKSRQILEKLKLRPISVNELYQECASRSELVAVFIAVLELVSMGSVYVSVSRSGDGYDLTSAGGNIDEILDNIED
ncbi:MAG: segregation/condensation protein A [Eubacteriales bacterium]|nr:segregation/condensation protein A [Eubacteriales bacterium]